MPQLFFGMRKKCNENFVINGSVFLSHYYGRFLSIEQNTFKRLEKLFGNNASFSFIYHFIGGFLKNLVVGSKIFCWTIVLRLKMVLKIWKIALSETLFGLVYPLESIEATKRINLFGFSIFMRNVVKKILFIYLKTNISDWCCC